MTELLYFQIGEMLAWGTVAGGASFFLYCLALTWWQWVDDSAYSLPYFKAWHDAQYQTLVYGLGDSLFSLFVLFASTVFATFFAFFAWPAFAAAACAFVLRFLRRSQKTLGKLADVAHSHADGNTFTDADISAPLWRDK